MFSKFDEHSQGCRGEAVRNTEEKKIVDYFHLNLPESSSQLSIVSTMSEISAPRFVYSRRKLQGKPVTFVFAEASANTKRSGDCLSVVSTDSPSPALEVQYGVSQVEPRATVVEAPLMPSLVCNAENHLSKLVSINECPVVQECTSDEGRKGSMPKSIDIDSINDSCSSSKSNVELASASMKAEGDDNGECSSSSVIPVEVMGEDLSERDLCISILRSHGILEGPWPMRTDCSTEDTVVSSSSSCSRSCKICGQSETTLNMLICDNCEEAFHTTCGNPRVKKIPVDEWFCHSCLKKKRKILKETTARSSTNITNAVGKCRTSWSKAESNSIVSMLRDTEPYTTGVRIGKGFQAEVPDWSGPLNQRDVNTIGELLEMGTSECINLHEFNGDKSSELSSIGNWLQCREAVEGDGICGKWRRAPLFEVQTDDWECFCSVLWDPSHADCAVPQELETDKVLKQVEYIKKLRHRIVAKRRRLHQTRSDGSGDTTQVVTKK